VEEELKRSAATETRTGYKAYGRARTQNSQSSGDKARRRSGVVSEGVRSYLEISLMLKGDVSSRSEKSAEA